MLDRTERALGLKPARLAADAAYGTGKLLAWLLAKDIRPACLAITLWDRLLPAAPIPSSWSGTGNEPFLCGAAGGAPPRSFMQGQRGNTAAQASFGRRGTIPIGAKVYTAVPS